MPRTGLIGRTALCAGALATFAAFAAPRPAVAQLTWSLVLDNNAGSGTRSARGLALSDAEDTIYVGYIQGGSSAGHRSYTLAGDPPAGTAANFFNVTDVSPSGPDHQAEAVVTDSRNIVYGASIKDGTSGDNARVFVFDATLGTNTLFVLDDIDFPGTTGETIGDLAIREDGGTIQLYVTRFRSTSPYVERYVVGGTGVGDATLTLDPTFNGTGRYSIPGATYLRGIDVAADGTMFIASRENDTVHRISADLSTATTATVVRAMDVALHNGHAYVTRYDGSSSEVVELRQADLSATGRTFTATGTFPHSFAGTGYSGIDIDADGRIFLNDQFYMDDVDRVLVSTPIPFPELKYDQDITPDAIFGSGNANGSWTVDCEDGVELGMRAKLRFPATNYFSSNGDGTYTFNTGSGTSSPPNPEWAFEWSVNTDFDGSSGLTVGDLTYEIGMDFDPGAGTDYLAFDQITPGVFIPYMPPAGPVVGWDHSMGTNATANGAGVEATGPTFPEYPGYLSTLNVAQNSWRTTFFDEAPFTFDPDVPGRYDYYLAAFDGGTEVARTEIAVIVVDGITLSLEADPCQTDQDAGLAGLQIAVDLWLRNPDEAPVTGYQAFLEFPSGSMTYVGGASSYSATPFTSHIQDIATAELTPGKLNLDGNTLPSLVGTTEDAKLATLVFTVAECDPQAVAFDTGGAFDNEASYLGVPYVTGLLDGPAVVADVTPPVITCPLDITQAADAGVMDGCDSAVVTWADPIATDSCTDVTVVCDPPSGSVFLAGTTTEVTCTATDACGNTDVCMFDVTVTETNVVNLTVQLVGSGGPVTRCIHLVADDCGETADVSLDFDATGLFSGPVEIPCGNWTQLCAKDEQHTQWDTTALVLNGAGTEYDAMTTLALDPGDTDNDGDVDINDVTFLIATFGDLTVFGGCPWDGVTRDADFNNDGAVGSPDYSLFSAHWLTTSDCLCSMPQQRPRGGYDLSINANAIDPWIAQRVDLDRNGTFNVQDVVIFETRNGLPHVLSAKMLGALRGSRFRSSK